MTVNQSLSRTIKLAETMTIPRLLVGMWQLSSDAWNKRPPKTEILEDMLNYYRNKWFGFDFADHYGPAETIYGEFLECLKTQPSNNDLPPPVGWTKYCPPPGPQTGFVVQKALQRSLDRIGVSILDCVQFHWWDYSDQRYMDALRVMANFRDQNQYLRHIALTNFDSKRLDEICTAIPGVLANQVQFSVVDTRPEGLMKEVCQKHGVKLTTYGTFCGGFLSEKWIGSEEPHPLTVHLSPSQRKYLSTIQAWSSWSDFQDLLAALDLIAKKHSVTIANVAVRYVLQQPHVAAVIVGARLGVTGHLEENEKVFSFELDDEDLGKIRQIQRRGQDLSVVIGDCGDEYRK